MSIFHAFILGIIQGITEFLPISSSAHLVIIPYLLGWDFPKNQIFPFDVLVQGGTLIAVIVYYRKDLLAISRSMAAGIKEKKPFEEIRAKTGWLAILATIPAVIIGFVFMDDIEIAFHQPGTSGVALLITAVLIFASEKVGKQARKITNLNWTDALIMGLFQALAVFPGISRSGSTISGGLFKHLDRKTAGHFTFLMAIPITAAAAFISLVDLFKMPNLYQFLPVLAIGFASSSLVGFFTIRWLLGYIKNHSLMPFAIYCLVLGIGVLIISAPNPIYGIQVENDPIVTDFHILYDPAIQWMIPLFNECSSEISSTHIVIEQALGFNSLDDGDILITFGESMPISEYVYEIGTDSLVLAIHKDNPLQVLTINALRQIYSGEIKTFKELQEKCPDCDIHQESNTAVSESIQVWDYHQDSYLHKKIQAIFVFDHQSPNNSIAPNPLLMEQALIKDSNAIGFLPLNAINERLKIIQVEEISHTQTQVPILATTYKYPDESINNLLLCMQSEFGE